MILRLPYILLALLLFSCQNEAQKKPKLKPTYLTNDSNKTVESIETLVPFDLANHLKNYQNLKSSITKNKARIKVNANADQTQKMVLAKNYMSKILLDSIFPYWLGTTWDFNGITEKPKDGEIACGYFVSTTLRDLGIKLNRYKVAQKAAADIIYELCDNTSVQHFSSLEKLSNFLEPINDYEILIVGLDFHVGFLFKRNGQAFFAHSNYIDREGVMIEPIHQSDALSNSQLYVVGNFSKNEKMIRNWLN